MQISGGIMDPLVGKRNTRLLFSAAPIAKDGAGMLQKSMKTGVAFRENILHRIPKAWKQLLP
jgi:hypothetical protein